MFRNHIAVIAATAAAGAMLLTACAGTDSKAAASPTKAAAPAPADDAGAAIAGLGFRTGTAQQNNAPANTGDFANRPGKPTTPAGKKWVQLSASKAGNLDPVVVDGAGFTLYRFDKDTANPSKSTCEAKCAQVWPPAITDGNPDLAGVDPAIVGTVTRGDGSRQITLAGWPVYRYIGDPKPGAWKGQNVGGTWFVVAPTGKKNLTCLPTPAPAAVTPPAASEAAGPTESTSTGNGYGY